MIPDTDNEGMLRPDEVEDAIAYGVARLADTPIDQLQEEAAAYRAERDLPSMHATLSRVMDPSAIDPADMAALDALAYGLAKLLHTPLGQLKAEANAYRAECCGPLSVGAAPTLADVRRATGKVVGDRYVIVILGYPISSDPNPLRFGAMSNDLSFLKTIVDQSPADYFTGTWLIWDLAAGRPVYMRCSASPGVPCPPTVSGSCAIVGSKAGAWANQALDYALNTDSPYVATAYMKPPPGHIYDLRSRWTVYAMRSRQALDDWYDSVVGNSDLYHFLAAYDKTAPEWSQGRPVAESVGDPDAYVGAVPVRDQLQHLDNLVASHETYWVAVAQQNPRSPVMRSFLQRHWDPWFTRWSEARYQLDRRRTFVDPTGVLREEVVPASDEEIARFVHEAAQGLTALRETAAYNGIPTPDLGTSQHGFSRVEEPRVAGVSLASSLQGERHMSAYDYVGADGSYPEVASRAVTNVHQQTPYPAYGYLRTGYHAAKIYVFNALEDARGWFVTVVNGQQPYEYAAVFDARNLSTPTLQDFGHTTVSGDAYVGQLWPFLAGLPLGGLAGYFLRRWQEEHPGQTVPGVPPGKLPAPAPTPAPPPKTSGDYVGGPWLDIEQTPYVGGPWLDLVSPYDNPWLASWASPSHARVADWVGATYGTSPYERPYHLESEAERRRKWPQTRALIEAAKRETVDYNRSYPAAAWVWALDPSGTSAVPGAELLGGTTMATPFSSYAQALDYMRSRIQTPHVALAAFDTASPHWPNPVNWTKSDDPAYEPIIAQRVAMSSPRMAGDYGGTAIGAALDDVRRKAESLAARREGDVVGVIHTSKDSLWHVLAFRSADDADDWINTATQDPASYTYAAYFDKQGVSWPRAYIEKVSGMRAPPGTELPRRTTTSGDRHRRHGWAA